MYILNALKLYKYGSTTTTNNMERHPEEYGTLK